MNADQQSKALPQKNPKKEVSSEDLSSSDVAVYDSLPVGTQTVTVSAEVASKLKTLGNDAPLALDGTRVWMRQDKGKFILHLGDVELNSLEE